MGIYAFAWTWATILAFLTPLGFDTSLVRFIPSEVEAKNWDKVRGLLSLAMRYTVRTSLLTVALAAVVIFGFDGKLEGPNALPTLIAISLIPVLSLLNLFQGIARSFEWVAQIAGPAYFVRPTLFLGLAFLAIEVLGRPSGLFMVFAAIGACTATLAMQYQRYRQRLPREISAAAPDTDERRTWFRTSLPMVLVASFELMLANTDIVMMGLIRGPAETGVYNLAVRTASCLLFVLFAITALAAPRIAALHARGERGALMQFSRQMRWWTFAPTLAGAVLLFFFGKHFFAFFDKGDAEFAYAYTPTLILTCGILVRSIAGPVDSLLMMTGRERSLAIGLAIATLLNVVGNLVLIPRYGDLGAASATALSVTVEVSLISVLAGMHLNFAPFLLSSKHATLPRAPAAPAASAVTATGTKADELSFEMLTTLQDLDRLEGEWRALEAHASADQFFQTWLWNRTWWEHFGSDKSIELRILVGRVRGRVVLVWPMIERRRGTMRVLEPTGGLLSCYADALVAPVAAEEREDILIRAWRRWLDEARVAAIHLRAVHARGAIACLFDTSSPSFVSEDASPEIDCSDFTAPEDYLRSRSKVFRKDIRRARKKLGQLGELASYADDRELEPSEAVSIVLAFKRDWIKDNGLPARTVVSPEGEAFLQDYCARVARGDASVQLKVSTIRLDGRIIACGLAFRMAGAQLEYLGGFAHDLRQVGPGKAQLADSVEEAIASGDHTCKLMTPRTPFKEHWTSVAPRVFQHYCATSLSGKLYRTTYLKLARPALKRAYNATIPRLKRRLS